ncbi:DUF1656 domain-containing protein [Labrys monachus]|uniref:DUF1656 domain-containing protein n=1 Tax=Labrys monachus TaxID=217067 RepID=A0ABU0FL57_9HYPH|nr:DUF1656 domain-containing protein [Labrys monachus]MDQ0394859.1 hypothetical protein [Labrys monachus]
MVIDLDLFGVYLPGLLVLAVAAFVLVHIVHRALATAGLYRLVWHPALFDVCLFVIFLGGLTALSERLLS